MSTDHMRLNTAPIPMMRWVGFTQPPCEAFDAFATVGERAALTTLIGEGFVIFTAGQDDQEPCYLLSIMGKRAVAVDDVIHAVEEATRDSGETWHDLLADVQAYFATQEQEA